MGVRLKLKVASVHTKLNFSDMPAQFSSAPADASSSRVVPPVRPPASPARQPRPVVPSDAETEPSGEEGDDQVDFV